MKKLAAAIAAVAVVAACASKTANVGAITGGAQDPPLRASVRQLRSDLQTIFSEAAVDHGIWAIAVRSLAANDVLFSANSFRLQVPASTQKVLTAAAAAERLGWDYRYTTRVYATGPVNQEGTLDGDLVFVSNGDPTINPRHPERWAAFDAWAKQLAEKGIRLIGGQLIGDDNAFAEPGWGLGWAWDDIAMGYGAPVGALQFNENQIELLIGPGQALGGRAIISVSPPGSGITIDHAVTTAASGGENRITLERIPGTSVLHVRGQIALDARPITEFAAVANPTLLYLNAMREALARQGIFVGGNTLDIDDLRVTPDLAKATLLLEDRSPALSEVVDVTLKWSRNGYAETLLRSMSPLGSPATSEAGLKALDETLAAWGITNDVYLARDGSGLSRYDYLSPDAVTAVLTRIWNDPKHRENFRSTLPEAGVSGSLAQRLRETPAASRVWAKTGSMQQVRSLSGYVTTLADEPLVFAIIVNGFRVPSREIDAAVDKALLRLVQFKR